ncbi:MAG: DNA-binding protein [Gemmatimonadetes bacterium]|nr:DNA-binding protein [Gemmatimonadota bacterium]
MSSLREHPLRAARLMVVLTAVGVGQALLAAHAVAQPPGGGRRSPRYDAATVVTVSGEVTTVERLSSRPGMTGIHLTIKTASGTESVHLGPDAFVDGKGIVVQPRDKVEVIGSRVTWQSAPVVLARDLTRGGTTVALRDSAGFPLWAGQGLRRRSP